MPVDRRAAWHERAAIGCVRWVGPAEGFLVWMWLEGVDGHGDAGGEAVDVEGCEGAGLEVLGEEADGGVGGESGDDAADKDLAANAVTLVAGEVGEFVDAGGEDDRGGEHEGEASGVFVVESTQEPGDHGDS